MPFAVFFIQRNGIKQLKKGICSLHWNLQRPTLPKSENGFEFSGFSIAIFSETYGGKSTNIVLINHLYFVKMTISAKTWDTVHWIGLLREQMS